MSTIPGINILFLRSIISADKEASDFFTSLPINLIFPFSSTTTEPF
jgi:hypothetical protein